jgi:hypothetical protein
MIGKRRFYNTDKYISCFANHASGALHILIAVAYLFLNVLAATIKR